MPPRDYYDVLGIARSASADEVKKAYRKLARQHHPDVNPGDKTAEAKFKEVQNAYDVLGEPEKRKQYDQVGHEAFTSFGGSGPRAGASEWAAQAGPGYENVDFSQFFGGGGAAGPDLGEGGGIFEDLLGRMRGGGGRAGRPRGPRRGQDVEAEIAIPFATAVLGGETSIDLAREDGSRESLVLKIPPGTDTGSKLRLRGRGGPGEKGAPSGDLTIEVTVDPHPFFRREGNNLALDLPITVGEAILGGKVDVPTLSGTTVSLGVPPGSSCGQKLRVRGRGVPAHGGQPDGDLFVALKIVVPKTIDDESRELIRQFSERNPSRPREGLW